MYVCLYVNDTQRIKKQIKNWGLLVLIHYDGDVWLVKHRDKLKTIEDQERELTEYRQKNTPSLWGSTAKTQRKMVLQMLATIRPED